MGIFTKDFGSYPPNLNPSPSDSNIAPCLGVLQKKFSPGFPLSPSIPRRVDSTPGPIVVSAGMPCCVAGATNVPTVFGFFQCGIGTGFSKGFDG